MLCVEKQGKKVVKSEHNWYKINRVVTIKHLVKRSDKADNWWYRSDAVLLILTLIRLLNPDKSMIIKTIQIIIYSHS